MGDLVIYCDAKHEGVWFRDLSPLLANAKFAMIGRRCINVPIIESHTSFIGPPNLCLYRPL